MLSAVPLQLLAYYIVVAKGLDVDKAEKPCKKALR